MKIPRGWTGTVSVKLTGEFTFEFTGEEDNVMTSDDAQVWAEGRLADYMGDAYMSGALEEDWSIEADLDLD